MAETVAEASPVKVDMSVWERLPCRRSAAITDRLFFWRTSSVLAMADMGWGMLPERLFSCRADPSDGACRKQDQGTRMLPAAVVDSMGNL
ncbi:hypothetical protein D3C87_613320 [compost metagenome]